MDIRDLVHALTRGDLLAARQWTADARRANLRWELIAQPVGLTEHEASIAAAMVELFASRAGVAAPWTSTVAGVQEPIVLDPGLEQMPRSFARAKATAPDALRRRNLIALPEFLDVA